MKKRFLSVLLVLAMMLSLIPAMSFTASAAETSGECGDGFYRDPNDLKWSYNNGTLTISGVGPMANYNEPEEAPWYDLREAITKVTVNGKSDVDDELVTIGDYAFFSVYPKLSTVEIGQNVSTIGKHSFDDCDALTNLTLSEGVREIDMAAFQYCESLSKVIIPASNWMINTNAFRGCAALRSVTIMPDFKNEAEIRRSAFAGCSSLETVRLGGNVSLAAPNIFADCPALKTVIIENVNEIYSNIFGVSSLNLPSLIFTADPPESIEDDAFEGVTVNAYYPADNVRWTEAVRQNYGGELTWIPITGLGTCGKAEADKVNWLLLNDGTMLIYGTGEMTDWDSEKDTPWYSHCSEIKKLSVSENIKNIGKNAFSGCSELEEVFALPDTLKTIGFKSFRKCTALKSFDIPDSVTKLEAEAFFGCTSLESVTGNKNVKQINYNTFNGCEKLKNAPIGNNVTAIGDNAFNGCISLTSVTFPNGLKSLSYNAFTGCTGLTKITIPASVTSVGKTAFRNCSAIQSVTMEGNVETIGENAFEGCDMLNRVIFYGNTPPTIDPTAFTNVTATVFYPRYNAIWAVESVRQNYGGSLTWVATVCSSLVHDYDALYLVKEATETEPAEYHAVCTRCGDITDSYIPKSLPDSATLTGIKAGDFLKRGATFKNNYPSVFPLYDCDIYVNGVKEVDLHKSKEWTAPECLLCTKVEKGTSSGKVHFVSACDFTEATCTEPATCVYCGAADGEAPGHTWEGATCTEPAVCTECGAIGEALGHDFTSPGTLISAADCTHSAVYTAKCVRCEETNGTLQVGSPLGHKYELIKKLSDSPLTYTAECLVCGEYNEAYEVPDKHYSVTDKVTTASMQVGRTVKPNSVITLDPISKTIGKKITVYIDGIKVYEDKNDYTTPNYCLKCVYKSGTTLRFETDCLFIRVNCENPKTCVYCGHTVGSALGHNFEDGYCTRCDIGIFEFDAKSLALDSALAFKFKGYLHDENPAADAYMEFKIGNIRTVNVSLTNAVKDEKGRYVFTCFLNVLEVDEKIEAIFHDGEQSVERENPLSVTDYLDAVLANHTGGTAEDTVVINLVNAISNYAHYAQIALDETHTEYTVGADGKYHGTAARSEITLHTSDELAQFASVKTVADGFTDVTATSRSLVLDDETAIVIYITPANDSYIPTVKVTDKNGNAVPFTCEKQTDGKYKVAIRKIAAHMLADNYTVDIDDGKLTYTNLSALSYAYSILSSSKSEAYKNAVSALYDYYIATIEYQNGGHDYGELIPTKDSTCTETGLITHYHCSICGKYFDENKVETALQDLVIEAKGHTLATTYSSDNSEHWHACTVCGEAADKELHDLDRTFKCEVCGKQPAETQGLTYALSGDGTYYIVTGIGTATDSTIIIPNTYQGERVKAIGGSAFKDNQNIKCVILGYYTDTIGEKAFFGCSNLQSVAMGNLKAIGDRAFEGCVKLQSVTSEWVERIGTRAFFGCSNLQSVAMGDLYAIGKNAFSDCSNLTSFTAKDVDEIGDHAFYNCRNLSSLTTNGIRRSIGPYAFSGCQNLKDITLHKSCTIGETTFSTSWIQSVTIPCTKAQLEHGLVDVLRAHSRVEEIHCTDGTVRLR